MGYGKLNTAVAYAWLAFENELFTQGVTNEQIAKIKEALNRKDVKSAVMDAAVEVVLWQ